MIIYFADRYLTILASASTSASSKGISVYSDKKSEEIGAGGANFTCHVVADGEKRRELETCITPGHYILKKSGDKDEFYTIIDSEYDSLTGEGYIYAEEAGLDLLNEIVLPYEADQAYPAEYYINKFAADSGFEVGINEISDLSRKLKWEGESTATERILSVATQFDNAEISFRFMIQGMAVTHKYIDIYKKRGKDTGVALWVDRDVNKIITKKSVANLATALYVTGGTQEGEENPITLDGIVYDDGRFHLQGPWLKDREANAIWTRYLAKSETGTGTGHLMKTYSYDTTSQTELLNRAINYLKKVSQMEVNYEVEVKDLPDGIELGDTVRVVDETGELYLSARVLKLETSEADKTAAVTLGEYLIRESGISDKVEALAAEFAQMAKQRARYTWTAYADDSVGTGISLDPEGKIYIGIANNQLVDTPDISNPDIYNWVKVGGMFYKIIASEENIQRRPDGTYSASNISIKIVKQWENGSIEPFVCDAIVTHSSAFSVKFNGAPVSTPSPLSEIFEKCSEFTVTVKEDIYGEDYGSVKIQIYKPGAWGQGYLGDPIDSIEIPVLHVAKDGADGKDGTDGKDAERYWLQADPTSIRKNASGSFDANYVYIYAKRQVGVGEIEAYACRIQVEVEYSSDYTWHVEYNSTAPESSIMFNIPSYAIAVRASMYVANVLVDQITVPIVLDGINGTNGMDGKNGADGADSTSYKMLVNAASIAKTASGTYKQTTITVQGRKQTGTGGFASYACRFKIETTTNTNLSSATWTSRYTSGSDVSSYTYTIPSGITGIRCSMYLAGGTTTLLDQVIIPVVSDGADGADGADANLTPTLLASAKTLASGGSFSVSGVKDLLLLEVANSSERSRRLELFIKGVDATRNIHIAYDSSSELYITITVTWSGSTATVKCTRFYATGNWSSGTSQIYYVYTL